VKPALIVAGAVINAPNAPAVPPPEVLSPVTFSGGLIATTAAIGTVVGDIFGIAVGATVSVSPASPYFTVSGTQVVTSATLPAIDATYPITLLHAKAGATSATTPVTITADAPTGGGPAAGDLNHTYASQAPLYAAGIV
jgi:hypothetical protein